MPIWPCFLLKGDENGLRLAGGGGALVATLLLINNIQDNTSCKETETTLNPTVIVLGHRAPSKKTESVDSLLNVCLNICVGSVK